MFDSPNTTRPILRNENVSGSYTLVDETEGIIEVPHPLKSERSFAMVDLEDPEFAGSVRAEFDSRWWKTTELAFLIAAVTRRRR